MLRRRQVRGPVTPARVPGGGAGQPGADECLAEVLAVHVAPADPPTVRALPREIAHHGPPLDQLDHERFGSLAARSPGSPAWATSATAPATGATYGFTYVTRRGRVPDHAWRVIAAATEYLATSMGTRRLTLGTPPAGRTCRLTAIVDAQEPRLGASARHETDQINPECDVPEP